MTESSLIDKLSKLFRYNREDIVVGIGDDAAVLKESKNRYLLVTCDAQVEGVHFKKKDLAPQVLAQRAITASLSDIAAMGGTPSYMLISVVLPQTTTADYIDKLTSGFAKAAKKYNVAIVGGNLSKGKQLVIDVFVLGYVKPNELLLRSGAKPGDRVLVTGMLGNATFLIARIAEGNIIAESKKATAMIDISDGLSTDLLRICDASGVGVRIYTNKLPISNTSRQGRTLNRALRTTQNKDRPYQLALNRGEDYELCFTMPPKHVNRLIKKVKEKTRTEVTVIGEILQKKEGCLLIDEKGRERKLEARGWDHFKKNF